jgi:hypothetical protein
MYMTVVSLVIILLSSGKLFAENYKCPKDQDCKIISIQCEAFAVKMKSAVSSDESQNCQNIVPSGYDLVAK